MTIGADGAVASVAVPGDRWTTRSAGCGRCGRRPDGALFVSTSNGDDDKVLRIDPA